MKIKTYCKFALLASLFVLFARTTQAQNVVKNDIIITRENNRIEVIIIEVNPLSLRYKKVSDPEGPVYSLNKSEISSLIRINGDIENFSENDKIPTTEKNILPASKLVETDTEKLKSTLLLYRKKAHRYKNMGYAGVFTGLLLTGIGVAVIAKSRDITYTSSTGYTFTAGSDERNGALLITAGLGAGIPLTIVGFVKNKRYSKRAAEVREELKKRSKPLSLQVRPGYNPAANFGSVALQLSF